MSRFNSKITTQSVSTIVARINSVEESIMLNPAYQRGVVWETTDKGAFIDSVLKGIIPNNVIFNIDDKGNYVCIDGKQRLTSLKEFKENKFCVECDVDDVTTYIYYDKIPHNKINDDAYKVLTQQEKTTFNQTNIHIVTYENLTYSEQTQVFSVIQKGKVLVSGEKVFALFPNDTLVNTFKEFCVKKGNILGINYAGNTDRFNHVPHLITIMHMINNNTTPHPQNKFRERYIRNIDTLAKLNREILNVDKLIDICYSDKLFNNLNIKKSLCVNMRYSVIYVINLSFIKENIEVTDEIYKYLRSSIRKTNRDLKKNNEINMKDKNIETFQFINQKIIDYYNEMDEGNAEMTDEEIIVLNKKQITKGKNDNENNKIPIVEEIYRPLQAKKVVRKSTAKK